MKIVPVVVVFIVIGIMTRNCQSRRRLRDIGFLNHVERTKEFKCELPQARSIPVNDLLLVIPSSDEHFYPPMTVLHRCDGYTGCCNDISKYCAPAAEEDVELVFLVTHLVDTNRPRHHEIINAKNHTRCHCVHNAN